MNDDLLSINHLASGQPAGGHDQDFLRVEPSRVGCWLAIAWRRILMGVVLIEIPLRIDTYLRHDLEAAQFGAISGFNISLTTICLFFLYAQWLPGRIVNSEKIRFSKPLLAYFAIATLSIFWAHDRRLAIYDVFLLTQAVLIFVYVVNTLTTKSEILFVMTFLLVGLAFQGCMMVLLKIYGKDIELGPLAFQIFAGSNRLAGSLGSPNTAGSYLAMVLPISLCVLFTNTSKSLHVLAFIALMAGSLGLLLTLSRGAWIASGAAFVICFVVAFRRSWLPLRAMVLVGLGFVVLSAVYYEPITGRLFGEDAGSAFSRVPLFQITTQMIAENPLGVGANNWDKVARALADSSGFRGEWYYTVHNKYLLIWSETGWLGLLAFLAFLGSTFYKGWRTCAQSNRLLAPIALGCATAIAGQAIHMNFDIFNSRVQGQMLFLVSGIVFAAYYITMQSPQPEGSLES